MAVERNPGVASVPLDAGEHLARKFLPQVAGAQFRAFRIVGLIQLKKNTSMVNKKKSRARLTLFL